MRRISSYIVLALGLSLSGGGAFGDTLLVESVESASAVARPTSGMTMDAVIARYGEPTQRSGPVGDPPITTWDYGDFVVYFEYQRVIHAVVPHK